MTLPTERAGDLLLVATQPNGGPPRPDLWPTVSRRALPPRPLGLRDGGPAADAGVRPRL